MKNFKWYRKLIGGTWYFVLWAKMDQGGRSTWVREGEDLSYLGEYFIQRTEKY